MMHRVTFTKAVASLILVWGVTLAGTAAAAPDCKSKAFADEGWAIKNVIGKSCGPGSSTSLETWAAVDAKFKDLEAFKVKWANCMSLPDISQPISVRDLKEWTPCREAHVEEWNEELAKAVKFIDKESKVVEELFQKKAWSSAESLIYSCDKWLELPEKTAEALASPGAKAQLLAKRAEVDAMKAKVQAGINEQLRTKFCPKGSKPNKKLEKILQAVYVEWVNRNTPGATKLKVLRMNGPVVTRRSGSDVQETANTVMCYRDTKLTAEPACHYDMLSFSRTKSAGGRWGEWTRGGAGEHGPLFCDNAK